MNTSIYIYNILVVAAFIWGLSLMAICSVSFKHLDKRLYPLWVTTGGVAVIFLLLQALVIGIFPSIVSTESYLFIDILTPLYPVILPKVNIYQVVSLNALAYFCLGCCFGFYFQKKVLGLDKKVKKGIKLICFTLSAVPLVNLITLIILQLNTSWANFLLNGFLPNVGGRVYMAINYFLSRNIGQTESEVLSIGWPTLIESIILLILTSAVLFRKRIAFRVLFLLTVVMLIDVLSTILILKSIDVLFLIRNISHLLYLTILFLFFSHPTIRDQFSSPKPKDSGREKPKYVDPTSSKITALY